MVIATKVFWLWEIFFTKTKFLFMFSHTPKCKTKFFYNVILRVIIGSSGKKFERQKDLKNTGVQLKIQK